MVELFNPHLESDIQLRMLKYLGIDYGPVEVHGSEMTFHNGSRPSNEAIAAARQKVIDEFNRADVKAEARRRILAAVKDEPTQINMLGWLITGGITEEERMLGRAIILWIHNMRSAGKLLANDPTYRDDKHWPKPPDGAREFMERF